MTTLRPRTERGHFCHPQLPYGKSELGAPLLYFPAQVSAGASPPGIVMAGTHGDEVSAVVALSCALRTLPAERLCHHVILAVNPDGCQLGLRANAHGVDLNRNFATANWQADGTVYRWNSAAEARDVRLSTGSSAGSEAETRALTGLLERLKPHWVVTIHDPLACIEDPHDSALGRWLAERFQLPLVTDVGYATPGSFGTWCAERQLHCITAEFPPISADAASEDYLDALIDLLTWSD
ncbi:murein tripeptide amidase MpaA [Microbulbifer sp. SAOS-129_SWC]|uniref:murein tripeptide amidase MpaA n=1 Tax=Microbulbifer sp. SAOS-129_SWC TaxID=3145235 RepID=UPI003217BD68